ncbi:MAG TPA: hypothetical protein VJ909_05560, partial [Prolixibacteraceae bacterium]|nr:hypothetical protein [Prolixibacteraceae bacterium]
RPIATPYKCATATMAGIKARVIQVKNLFSPHHSPQLYGLEGPRFFKGWVTQTSLQKKQVKNLFSS